VDVFRRASACEEAAHDAVAAGATCLWLQLGIASEAAGRIAHAAGLGVVMDRCTLIEHHRLLAGRRW
jgi:predicted CoA-binding protein